MSQANQSSSSQLESHLSEMPKIQELETLRPLGKLEQVSACCHHLGFFNNVGLSAEYKISSSSPTVTNLRHLIFTAVANVLRKHRVLFAIPVNEDTPETFFASLSSIDLTQCIIFLRRSQPVNGAAKGKDEELDAILQKEHNTDFKSEFGNLPFWRLIILQAPGAEDEFTASFIYHHAIGDGASGMVFHKEFSSALEVASSSPPLDATIVSTVEPDKTSSILESLEELHPLPINPTPPSPPTVSHKVWTGNPIFTPCKSRWASLCLSPSTSGNFFQECKAKKLSVTSVLSSVIATTLFSILPPTEEALSCTIPVSLRPWLKVPREFADGAIGTYFDATRVQFTRPERPGQGLQKSDFADGWAAAQQASSGLHDYLQNISPSGEPYTSIAVLKTLPDISVIFSSMPGNTRGESFEVTNVGVFSAPKSERPPHWHVGKVVLSRSALVTGPAVTLSVATGGNGSMTIGFSWQDGALDDDVINFLRQRVESHFEKYEDVLTNSAHVQGKGRFKSCTIL